MRAARAVRLFFFNDSVRPLQNNNVHDNYYICGFDDNLSKQQ